MVLFAMNSPCPQLKEKNAEKMNAKCFPPRIIHTIVLIQVSVRMFLARRKWREIVGQQVQQFPIPAVGLALYLSRRARNGFHMDVDDELDILGRYICSSGRFSFSLAVEYLAYCSIYDLTEKLGYVMLKDKLRSEVVTEQIHLMNLLSDPNVGDERVNSRLAELEASWPSALHNHFVFAKRSLADRSKAVEYEFMKRLDVCHTVLEIQEVTDQARITLPSASKFHAEASGKLEAKLSKLRQEICILYDHPVIEGNIPELEAAVLQYSTELPRTDPVLSEFVLEICFLFLKYIRDFEQDFDIRDELLSFKWCLVLGAEYVLPEIRKNTTDLDFKSAVHALVDRLPLHQSVPPRWALTQLARIRKASGISDVRADLDTEDQGSVWDLLGDDFQLPPISEGSVGKQVEDKSETAAVPQQASVSALPPWRSRRPDFGFPEPAKTPPHEAYTYYDTLYPSRVSGPPKPLFVTRFPLPC